MEEICALRLKKGVGELKKLIWLSLPKTARRKATQPSRRRFETAMRAQLFHSLAKLARNAWTETYLLT